MKGLGTIAFLSLGARSAILALSRVPGGWAVIVQPPALALFSAARPPENVSRAEVASTLEGAATDDIPWLSYGPWDLMATSGAWEKLMPTHKALLVGGGNAVLVETAPDRASPAHRATRRIAQALASLFPARHRGGRKAAAQRATADCASAETEPAQPVP